MEVTSMRISVPYEKEGALFRRIVDGQPDAPYRKAADAVLIASLPRTACITDARIPRRAWRGAAVQGSARRDGEKHPIGAPGFEPGTSPTRTVRATRLRHAPRAAIISERLQKAARPLAVALLCA
jgi:hypothetical protein